MDLCEAESNYVLASYTGSPFPPPYIFSLFSVIAFAELPVSFSLSKINEYLHNQVRNFFVTTHATPRIAMQRNATVRSWALACWSRLAPSALLLYALLLSSVMLRAAATCYDYDGKEMKDVFPCDATADVSQCCSKNDFCLSNGLCLDAGSNNGFTQQGCTSKGWDFPCQKYCRDNAGMAGMFCAVFSFLALPLPCSLSHVYPIRRMLTDNSRDRRWSCVLCAMFWVRRKR